jgi:hypothetical protein
MHRISVGVRNRNRIFLCWDMRSTALFTVRDFFTRSEVLLLVNSARELIQGASSYAEAASSGFSHLNHLKSDCFGEWLPDPVIITASI